MGTGVSQHHLFPQLSARQCRHEPALSHMATRAAVRTVPGQGVAEGPPEGLMSLTEPHGHMTSEAGRRRGNVFSLQSRQPPSPQESSRRAGRSA